MSNGKIMIIHLIAGLITKTLYKWGNTFPNHRSFLAETLELKLINFDNKLISLNRKINSKKKKHLLVENEFKKWQTFD